MSIQEKIAERYIFLYGKDIAIRQARAKVFGAMTDKQAAYWQEIQDIIKEKEDRDEHSR